MKTKRQRWEARLRLFYNLNSGVMKVGNLFRCFVSICCLACSHAAEKTISAGPGNDSLKFEIQRAIDKGLASLEKAQNGEGWWSTADHPALTGLALVAFQGD